MRGSNLHAWWDSGMIKYVEENDGPLLASLEARKPVLITKEWKPEMAAEESCRIVEQDGLYPGRKLDVRYINRYRDKLEMRLKLLACAWQPC